MDKIQVTIETMQRKSITSKKTGKTYELYTIHGADGVAYEAFIGKWNSHWKPGDTVEAMYSTSDYNGQTQHNLKAPPEFRQQFNGSGNPSFNDQKLTTVLENQDKIMQALGRIEAKLVMKAGEPSNWDDTSVVSTPF